MKKRFIALLAIFCTLNGLTGCSAPEDVNGEKEAIKSVLIAESQTWIEKDVVRAKSFYVQDSFDIRMGVDDSTYSVIKGWDSLSVNLDHVFAADRTGITEFKVDKNFISIKIMDQSAWVACRETNTYKLNGVFKKGVRLQLIVMQKIDGQWKISGFLNGLLKLPALPD